MQMSTILDFSNSHVIERDEAECNFDCYGTIVPKLYENLYQSVAIHLNYVLLVLL